MILSPKGIDLLPFVEHSHLRWVDEKTILLRRANSHLESLSRRVNPGDFFQLVGFYLAEGNKVDAPALITDTNQALATFYHGLGAKFIKGMDKLGLRKGEGSRQDGWVIDFGGRCVRAFFLNSIDAMLSFLEAQGRTSEFKELGLRFLRGCSDGDGSVSKSAQPRSRKFCMRLCITEASRAYALKLRRVLRKVLGTGWTYRPRNRNYYIVGTSPSPKSAAILFRSGFFSEHHENRRRLAAKALDSVHLTRLLRLYSLFKDCHFSKEGLVSIAPEIPSAFVWRAARSGQLIPSGVVRPGESKVVH